MMGHSNRISRFGVNGVATTVRGTFSAGRGGCDRRVVSLLKLHIASSFRGGVASGGVAMRRVRSDIRGILVRTKCTSITGTCVLCHGRERGIHGVGSAVLSCGRVMGDCIGIRS